MTTDQQPRIPTLAEMNANPQIWDWSETYRVETRVAVGAQSRSRRASPKVHLIVQHVVLEVLKPGAPCQPGKVWSSAAWCMGNGENAGATNPRLDTADVTCSKCRAILDARAR